MKYEKLGSDKGNRKFLYGFITCAVLLILFNIIFSYAKYKVVDSVKLASGTVNYSAADFNFVAINVQQKDEEGNGIDSYIKKEDNQMPLEGYKLNETKTYCQIGNDKYEGKAEYNDYGIQITYKSGKVNFDGVKEAKTKCYLYFDVIKGLTPTERLVDLGVSKITDIGTNKISGTACDDNINNATHDSGDCTDTEYKKAGVYGVTGEEGLTSYIYRGTVNNNWVKFGKDGENEDIWWRIIRINENGTIRLIYSGTDVKNVTGTNAKPGIWASGNNGADASIKTTYSNNNKVQKYNENYNDNTYVGFYYGKSGQNEYEKTHTNETPSTIAIELKTWYKKTNLIDASHSEKIDGSTGFCNDREINKTEVSWNNSDTKNGFGNSITFYASYGRLSRDGLNGVQYPTLVCANKKRDLFTTKEDVGEGNGKLEVPVGLITSDEAIFAGGFVGRQNYGYWLWTGHYYWTISPWQYFNSTSSGHSARVFDIQINGNVSQDDVPDNHVSVRPVINLKANVAFKSDGNGTIDNPYVVVTE